MKIAEDLKMASLLNDDSNFWVANRDLGVGQIMHRLQFLIDKLQLLGMDANPLYSDQTGQERILIGIALTHNGVTRIVPDYLSAVEKLMEIAVAPEPGGITNENILAYFEYLKINLDMRDVEISFVENGVKLRWAEIRTWVEDTFPAWQDALAKFMQIHASRSRLFEK